MEKVTLTRVFKKSIETKNGPATKVAIKTNRHGNNWISGFENSTNKDWSEGDQVEIEVEKNGDFLNFKTPSKKAEAKSDSKMDEVHAMLKELLEVNIRILKIAEPLFISQAEMKPDEDVVPF